MRDLDEERNINLTLIENLKENFQKFLHVQITDKQLSHYLGQTEKYVTYTKKNARRNPVYQISLQRLEEYIITIRKKFQNKQLRVNLIKLIRRYSRTYHLKVGKNQIYRENLYFVENYFQEINSKEKAYWLGFIYADGSVGYTNVYSKKGHRFLSFRFSQSPKHPDNIKAVDRLANVLGYDPHKVRILSNGNYGFEILGKTLTKQLVNQGVIIGKDKTYNIEFPNLASRELELAFLLGYFDGDGTMGTHKITSASKKFLDQIRVKFRIQHELDLVDVRTWTLPLGCELFNEMMENYHESMPRKRRSFESHEERVHRLRTLRLKPTTPKITKDFLEELQILLLKFNQGVISEYYNLTRKWLYDLVKKYNLFTLPIGYWVKKQRLGITPLTFEKIPPNDY